MRTLVVMDDLTRHRLGNDPANALDYFASPNCPECLMPSEPVVTGWWCAECQIVVSAAGDGGE